MRNSGSVIVTRAPTRGVLSTQFATMKLNKQASDGKSQSRALEAPRDLGIDLSERRERNFDFRPGHPDASQPAIHPYTDYIQPSPKLKAR